MTAERDYGLRPEQAPPPISRLMECYDTARYPHPRSSPNSVPGVIEKAGLRVAVGHLSAAERARAGQEVHAHDCGLPYTTSWRLNVRGLAATSTSLKDQ